MGVPNSTRSIKPYCPSHFDVGGFAASIHINTGNGIVTRARSPISSGLGVSDHQKNRRGFNQIHHRRRQRCFTWLTIPLQTEHSL